MPAKRLPPISLHDAVWWALAAAIALLGAQLFWMIVTPVSPLGDWRPAGVRVMSPAARGALFASFDPFNRNAAVRPAGGPATVTSLALTLYGIRVNAASGGGSAIIAGADGVQQVYRVGAEVMPGVTLAAVHFDHVGLSHNGSTELLYLDQSQPATPAAPGAPSAPAVPTIAPASPSAPPAPAPAPAPAPPATPLTVDSVRQGVSFQPRVENGKVMGLEVSATANGTAFRAAGFQPGDVVTTIGGRAVTGPADSAALIGSLKPGASVPITVRRDGEQLPLAITLGR